MGNDRLFISKRAIRSASVLALAAVVAISLLLTGEGGATAFNADASDRDARHMPIPQQYAEQCSNGTAVPIPANNAGLVADCAALLASKDTLEGTTGNLNWSADRAISDWDGVTTANNRVSGLDIENNRLNGTIPAALGNLDNLAILNLADNRLTGKIPIELGNLDNIRELWLVDNRLTGEIPIELSNLDNFRDLRLSGNQLTGQIPVELGIPILQC